MRASSVSPAFSDAVRLIAKVTHAATAHISPTPSIPSASYAFTTKNDPTTLSTHAAHSAGAARRPCTTRRTTRISSGARYWIVSATPMSSRAIAAK